MTVGNGGRAAVLLASKTEEAKFDLRRQLEAVGLWLIGAPSGRGWLAAVGRLTRAADLLVVVVGDQSSMSRMRAAALAARCYSIPLIVVEVAPGDSAAMQRSRVTRVLTGRTVSRVVSGSRAFESETLVELGLGSGGIGDGVGPLTMDDLGAVVRIHQSAFPHSAMSHLGPRVVERYYRWQFIGDHPVPFAVGFRRDGALTGYLFGGLRRDAVSGYARRFLPTIVWGALTHPGGVRRLAGPKVMQVMRLMFRRRPSRSTRPGTAQVPAGSDVADGAVARPSFGVLSIAMDEAARGTGEAAALMAAAESRTRDLGWCQLDLTVEPKNGRAVRFYEREGWDRVVDHGEEWDGRMIRVFDPRLEKPEIG